MLPGARWFDPLLGGVVGGLIGCVGIAAYLFHHLNEVRSVRTRLDDLQEELDRFDKTATQLLEAFEHPGYVEESPIQSPRRRTLWDTT
ncbi:hypothetical protein TWF696_005317 [Orbilia brochopaga]|uniref:Uncharacterized protein n=1 Tax=Orbilia brochopaga TaxID=3140254 RepID=A0AAV9V3P9_9PEZI